MSLMTQTKAIAPFDTTVNVFHHRADNVGDRLCGSAQFFWPEHVRKVGFRYALTKPENAIYGGGQIFGQLEAASGDFAKDPPGALIAWAVGVPPKGKDDARVLAVAKRFSLFGVRNYEWHSTLRFVPCASCMSSAFDNVPAPQHDVVIFAHRKKTPNLFRPDGVPLMINNNQPFQTVLNFLASGRTVVTSSYHGVYWAQLLGRKVICLPYSDKFSTFEHAPTKATADTWQDYLKDASQVSGLLEKYRALNRAFAADVEEVLASHE